MSELVSKAKPPGDNDEDQISALAALAGRNAYERALQSGQKVLIAEAGFLYEVAPDGSRQVVKRLHPPVPVQAGRVLKIW